MEGTYKPAEIGRLSAAELLGGSDPLSDDACASLLDYREEDELVDFKETFDLANPRAWIELAIDCVAFANTLGGYVVFGVRNKTWERIGLSAEVVDALADTKQVLEKVNRKLAPQITRARTRGFLSREQRFVVLCAPASLDCTHIFEADVEWTPPGTSKSVGHVRKGAIYVRRAGSNHILTSTDFEQLIERRLQRFRGKVLEGLARVVNASPDHEVVTVVKGSESAGGTSVRVVDAPDLSGLRGKSLAVSADTLVEKVAIYMTLTRAAPDHELDRRILYEAFVARNETHFDEEQREWLATYSAVLGAPVFFWLKDSKTARSRELLDAAFRIATFLRKVHILNYSGFLGANFYKTLYQRLGDAGPDYGARPYRDKHSLLNVGRSRNRAQDAARATELARDLVKGVDAHKFYELERLDCALYAPFD